MQYEMAYKLQLVVESGPVEAGCESSRPVMEVSCNTRWNSGMAAAIGDGAPSGP